MGSRRGRWAVIAVLDDGTMLRGQNRPRFPQRGRDEKPRHERIGFEMRQRRRVEDERRAEDRLIRTVLGVPVR